MKPDELSELSDFLKSETRLDIKSVALHHVLSFTGTPEGRKMLISNVNLIDNVTKLAFEKREQKAVIKDAFFTFINLTSDEIVALQIIHKNQSLIDYLLDYILDPESKFADVACGVLSNLSRGKTHSELIYSVMETNEKYSIEKVLQAFCIEGYNKANNLDYLAPFICNLTQICRVRSAILKNTLNFKRLLPYTTYERSVIRRGGINGSIKNCCFEYDEHENLLKSDIDLLSRLLLPLAGPEEFDDDDMNRLPEDLQYLPPDKQRESDPDIRVMLLETIILLCSKKACREYIKEKNTYVIIRELYNWEKEEQAKEVCMKLINILISDEPEGGMENLHEIVIPENLSQKFYEYNQSELEKNFE